MLEMCWSTMMMVVWSALTLVVAWQFWQRQKREKAASEAFGRFIAKCESRSAELDEKVRRWGDG